MTVQIRILTFAALASACTQTTAPLETSIAESHLEGTCQTPLAPHDYDAQDYRYRANTTVPWHYYRLTVIKRDGAIRYYDSQLDGPYRGAGWLDRWTPCTPGAPPDHVHEQVTLHRDDGAVKTCTHLCLGDDPQGRSRSELHCPNAQLALTRHAEVGYCLAPTGTPPETPPPATPHPVVLESPCQPKSNRALLDMCGTLAGIPSADWSSWTMTLHPMCVQDCLLCSQAWCGADDAAHNQEFARCWQNGGRQQVGSAFNCPGSTQAGANSGNGTVENDACIINTSFWSTNNPSQTCPAECGTCVYVKKDPSQGGG